ncbi:L-2-amino-thiazoline-4-carboxylic acid hydrolase [Defluviimonas sp. WL0050]|uniref:L-2-amino-thiazoline-4-carboxylic acid hydrolase n=1 Tax=Albidovulum litorale TaxID=2984134 RepID=A0ABT2ZN44_9RHOB|nr:L-2-amino-thiazoline-4-carboxylic acid hydrolase [Defluviimonas sp. WL0050]MCV2872425.1 L-2-amino-thiazoline-4-carboxylic acid hydrolase [Defluviimonas sp. WL0050]
MKTSDTQPVTLMQRVRLQAEVLVPLLRRLRTELGEEAANALVYPVLRSCMKDWISSVASSASSNPTENFYETSEVLANLFEGDVDLEILEHNAKKLDVDVTGCRFADFFRQLGEPELGAILTCELDDHIAELSAPTVTLSRSATIMNGAARCPFRYQFKQADT